MLPMAIYVRGVKFSCNCDQTNKSGLTTYYPSSASQASDLSPRTRTGHIWNHSAADTQRVIIVFAYDLQIRCKSIRSIEHLVKIDNARRRVGIKREPRRAWTIAARGADRRCPDVRTSNVECELEMLWWSANGHTQKVSLDQISSGRL